MTVTFACFWRFSVSMLRIELISPMLNFRRGILTNGHELGQMHEGDYVGEMTRTHNSIPCMIFQAMHKKSQSTISVFLSYILPCWYCALVNFAFLTQGFSRFHSEYLMNLVLLGSFPVLSKIMVLHSGWVHIPGQQGSMSKANQTNPGRNYFRGCIAFRKFF